MALLAAVFVLTSPERLPIEPRPPGKTPPTETPPPEPPDDHTAIAWVLEKGGRAYVIDADTGEKQKIVVEGYTDSNGNDDSNLRLSQSRAESVRSYLISKGVKAERIQAVGKGEASPIAPNDTAEGRANNRRVEIVVEKRASE